MKTKDPREILKTIVTSDLSAGGLMQPEQVDKFLSLTLDYSAMLKQVRVEKKRKNRGEHDTLNVGSVVSEGASEEPAAPTAAEEQKPAFGKIEYLLKKLRSAFNVSTESILDNIEAEIAGDFRQIEGKSTNFRDTLMMNYARRIGSDHELIAIQGDESIADTSTKTNRLLRTNNGWDVITATGCNYVDALYTNVSFNMFAAALAALPSPYLKDLPRLRWFVSPSIWINWSKNLAPRQTDTGDKVLEGYRAAPFGIPMEMVPLIPESKTSTVGTTVNTGLTFLWLTYPENFIYTIRRQVEVYWEFAPKRDRWENTTYSENDMAVENKDAVVKVVNIDPTGSDYS